MPMSTPNLPSINGSHSIAFIHVGVILLKRFVFYFAVDLATLHIHA